MPTPTVTYAILSDAAQSPYGSQVSLTGFTALSVSSAVTANGAAVGFYGQAWVNTTTGEVIISNRGTVPGTSATSIDNFEDDAQLTFEQEASSQTAANQFAIAALQAAQTALSGSGVALGQVYLTGHSLGGYHAQGEAEFLTTPNTVNSFPSLSYTVVTFNSPGIGGINTTTSNGNYTSIAFITQGDVVNQAGGNDLPGTGKVTLAIGPEQYATGGVMKLGAATAATTSFLGGLLEVAEGGYFALSAHSMSAIETSMSTSAYASVPVAEINALGLTTAQFQEVVNGTLTLEQLNSTQQSDVEANPSLDNLIGAGSTSTSSNYNSEGYNSSGYNSTGFNSSGYNIAGRNASGDLDPSIPSGGETNTNVIGGETLTFNVAQDGSVTDTVSLPDGTSISQSRNTSGQLLESTTTNPDGSTTTDIYSTVSGQYEIEIKSSSGTLLQKESIYLNSNGSGTGTSSNYSTGGVLTSSNYVVQATNGSIVDTDTNYNSSGTALGSIVYDETSSGTLTGTVSGTGNIVTAGDGTITVDNSATASISGTQGGTINIGSSDNLTLVAGSNGMTLDDTGSSLTLVDNGGGNTVTLGATTASLTADSDSISITHTGDTLSIAGSGDSITSTSDTITGASGFTGAQLTGNGNTLNLTSDSDAAVTITGTSNVIEGSNETITLGSGFTGTIDGSNDTINMVGGSASSVTISGTGNTVSGDSGTDSVSLTSASDTLTVSGTDGTINIGATGDTLTTSTEYVDATSGEALTVDGTSDAITGTSNTITLGSDFNGNVTGNSMTIDMNDGTGSAGSNTGVGLYGSSFTVNDDDGSNYVNLESANETGTVNGDGTVQVFATGDHLTSSNQYVYVNNTGLSLSITGGSDAIQGDDDTVSTSSGFQGNIYGDEMTVDMTGNSDSAFGVYGTHFTVNNNTGSNYINLVSAGQTGTISGTGGLVQIYADDVSLTDSHETILNNVDLSDNSITGTNDSIYGYLDTNISISGTSDTFTGNYNSGIDFGTTHTADTVIGSADSGTDWANTTGFENEDGDEQYYYASGSTDQTSFYVIPDSEFNSNTEAFIESGFAHGADSSNAGAGSYGNAPSFSGYSGSPPDTDEFGSGGGYYGGSGSGYYDDPLVLNLSGQSVQTEGRFHSAAHFDMQNNGKQVQTGWVTPGEGLLVLDPTDAPITSASQLLAGFNALDALDSNGDGVLNSSDAAWDQLRVWVDSSGTGQYQTGQLYTLDQLGITSINLNATAVNANSNGNTIEDQSTFTTTSGTGDIAGVSLAFNSDTAGMQLNSLISGMATFHAPQGASTSSPPLPADFSGHEHHHFAAAAA
jgi:hypothetical protein